MSRKKKRIDRGISGDIIYNNVDVEKFINILMISGKKTIARNILYKAFNYIKNFYKKNPIYIFSLALDNCSPLIESKNIKNYKNTRTRFTEIKKIRRRSLSMRWIKTFSRIRKEKFMYLRLANELIDASKKRGGSFKKKDSFYKVFDSKRSYYRNKK